MIKGKKQKPEGFLWPLTGMFFVCLPANRKNVKHGNYPVRKLGPMGNVPMSDAGPVYFWLLREMSV
jgi:hypothetical protein